MNSNTKRVGHLPGEEFIWVVIFGEILVFTCFFCLFLVYRADDLLVYQQSRAQLNSYYGFSNLFVMLLSSWLVVTSLEALRRRDFTIAKYTMGMALGCGILFCLLKYAEYQGRFSVGIFPHTNEFFRWYFLLTGIHLVHVVIATGVIAWFFVVMCRGKAEKINIQNVESGASYWHMADFLWIILFPLLYILP